MSQNQNVCQECGSKCSSCLNNKSLHLHQEIETLKNLVTERDRYITRMETSFLNSTQQSDSELSVLMEEHQNLKQKYDRLFESHKKLHKVNQGLEDKLLKIVDKFESEKASLNRDISCLTAKLVDTRVAICELEDENERYRNDCNLAVQLLQCKPSNFVSHKLTSLPGEVQQKVKLQLTHEPKEEGETEVRMIRVPVATFPPTAMVYSINQIKQESTNVKENIVPASMVAKVLEQRETHRISKHRFCSCRCQRVATFSEKATQTCHADFNAHRYLNGNTSRYSQKDFNTSNGSWDSMETTNGTETQI